MSAVAGTPQHCDQLPVRSRAVLGEPFARLDIVARSIYALLCTVRRSVRLDWVNTFASWKTGRRYQSSVLLVVILV